MFESKLKEYLQLIEFNLKKALPNNNELCPNFSNSIAYSTLDGGKRLRPVLTLAVCEMLNGNFDAAIAFACAIEFVHAGSLIHDDLPCMDDSSFRRGKPSCHSKFGETMAVLAGDGLFLSAFELLASAKIKSEQIVKACACLGKFSGLNGMVLGQAIDMFINKKLYNNKQTLEILNSLKTASLIRAACAFGCFAAEVDEQTEKQIDSYAKHLGLAFQICDDIIDFKDEANVEEKNKFTYVNLFGLCNAKKEAKAQTEIAINTIKNFNNNQFLIHLTELMLKRIK